MKNAKKVLSVLLSLMLVLGAVSVGGVSASAEYPLPESVDIIYGPDYNDGPIVITENKTIELKGVTIEGTDIYPSPITIEPGVTVNIILSGENTLTAKSEKNSAGIFVNRYTSDPDNPIDAVLNIYGREGGKLTVTGGFYGAGIGGVRDGGIGSGTPGVINIYSGEIYAQGGTDASGIGAGKSSSGNEINIYGGNVTAIAGSSGAGIGTGYATSGEASNKVGSYSAGIINITGGTVRAAAGKFKDDYDFDDFDADNSKYFFENCYESNGFGAGIGGGYGSNGCSIKIGGDADVIALGSCGGAGIGSGRGTYKPGNYEANCTPYDITIEGNAKVVAASPDDPRINQEGGGAGIGGGKGFDDGGSIKILDNADVTAIAEAYAAAIGGSWKPGDINTDDNTLIARPRHLKIAHTATVKAVSDGFASAIGYRVGEKIEYGTYPQSKVTDETILAALNAKVKDSKWISYGYYYSDTFDTYGGNMQPGDFMKYYDTMLDGVKYRAVTFTGYRPDWTKGSSSAGNSHQDDNGYYVSDESNTNIYWFRFDPVEWKVLDPDTGLILCNSAIDSQPYCNYVIFSDGVGGSYTPYSDAEKTCFATDFANSSIRQWLNNDFMNTAFSSSQQENILLSENLAGAGEVNYANNGGSLYNFGPTSDKIFLLSETEILNMALLYVSEGINYYNYEDFCLPASDYAKCQGLDCTNYSGFSELEGMIYWWTRSPSETFASYARVVNPDGSVTGSAELDTCIGVVPAMRLNELKSDPTGAPIRAAIPEGAKETYDNTEHTGVESDDGYTLSGTVTATDAGEYTATATLEDGYIWKDGTTEDKEITWKITPKSIIDDMITLTPDAAEYNGGEITPEITVKYGEIVLTKDTDYTVIYSNNVNASENAKVTVTGKGNYTGSADKTFRINPKAVTITANDQTYPFNDQIQGEGDTAYEDPAEIAEKVTADGLVSGDTLESIILDGQAKDIDEYEGAIVPSSAVIKNSGGQDVTSNYNITYTAGKLTITSVNAPLTINYVYENGTTAADTYTDNIEIFTGYSVTSPEITGYTPDKETVEGTMENIDGVTETVTYMVNTYTATLLVEGEVYEEIPFTYGQKSITLPDVPKKEGHTGAWESYSLGAEDIEISAIYKVNTYTAQYIVDGEGFAQFDVEFGQAVTRPRTPQKDGYTFKWIDEIPETMPAEDVTINGEFTPIEYTATFVDENGETVEKVKFTVEDESITEPAVPEKPNYTGKWEEYTLGANDITIKPVYTLGGETVVNIDSESEITTDYKESKRYAFEPEFVPEGATAHVFYNGEDRGEGTSIEVKEPTEDYTVECKAFDADGNEIASSGEIKVKVKNSFFDRLKWFFNNFWANILKTFIEAIIKAC